MCRESFDNGKYTVVFEDGEFKALRYGEEWRSLTGDGMILSMLHEVERLRTIVAEVHDWAVCSCLTTPEDMYRNFPRIVEITTPVGLTPSSYRAV